MEALFVVVPVLGLIIWLAIASLRHERRHLKKINDGLRAPSTPEQMVTCAEREVKQRRHVYPRWVGDQWTTQAFADQQIAMMEQIARDYRAKADAVAAKSDLFGGAA